MNRRRFLQTTLAGAAVLGLSRCDEGPLPRWRGFNLLEKFTDRQNAPFVEDDFRMMADWGFNFARLPLSYWCWSTPQDPFEMDHAVIDEIDQAVEYGQKYGVHVNLNLHRAPGYCVNPPAEPLDLWTDTLAQDAFAYQWTFFADRYRGLSNHAVSFDLLNEPAHVDEPTYARVMRRVIDAIRSIDPDRLIVVDGLRWGRDPVPSLADTGVWQSTRGYDPMLISHYRAGWVGRDTWPEVALLQWPYTEGDQTYDRAWLRDEIIGPWQPLVEQGVTVHVGEWGAFRHTPHDVALAWMRDFLELWQERGWGWALWNFRGAFGLLDSGRADVAYEAFHGHELDRAMLELLQAY
ncbi:glycoside hydrolase [Rhodothermaceae bacterium RA]|nr:glycoside hydrolase [Rhodothermaceae bacterium RA]